MGYNLKQYTEKTYGQLADEFEQYFIQDKFKTSADNILRDRYEFKIPEMDFWINQLGLQLSNFGEKHGDKFKSGLFSVLKKRGWSKSKIPGRWQKHIYK